MLLPNFIPQSSYFIYYSLFFSSTLWVILVNNVLHILLHLWILCSYHSSHTFQLSFEGLWEINNLLLNDVLLIRVVCGSERWWLLFISSFGPSNLTLNLRKLNLYITTRGFCGFLIFTDLPLIHELLVLHLCSLDLILHLITFESFSQGKFHSILSQFLLVILLLEDLFLFLILIPLLLLLNLILEYSLQVLFFFFVAFVLYWV